MIPYRILVVASIVCYHASEAFLARPAISPQKYKKFSVELQALPPPMIIGPMIKKMREEEAKKKMPMANRDEAAKEAPGLRVGAGVWKWPPIWPYDDSFFKPADEEQKAVSQQNIQNMASMITGIAQVPTASTEDAEEEKEVFDPIEYWGETYAMTRTELDSEAVEKLKAHYSFYLRDGMSILEFGAAEESYLPIKPSRHVGVGAAAKLMEQNPSLTQRLVVDLNKVEKDRDVDNDDLRRLAQEPFDAIIMANTVDYLAYPREVFRSAWYLLKPGGIMIVSFSGKEATKDKFKEAQTKMWRGYNDDQHLWITGSFFQFSAGDGWENLLGFDISPSSAKKNKDNPVAGLLDRGKPNNLYVVQATKGYQYEGIDPDNVEKSLNSICWMLPVLESRDKKLLLPRLTAAYENAENDEVREAIERNIPILPRVYEALVKMDTFAFTFSMQSQLAADLISDPDFTASEEQMLALKQGLGLRAPSKEFWVPIGENTGAMGVEDRINLLAYIVPRFGSGNADQEEALQAFVTGLKPTYSVIRNKCPELSESDVQLLGTELMAAEILRIGHSTREEFAAWLAAFSSEELRALLNDRKSIRENARKELEQYKIQKAEEQERLEEYRRLYEEQLKTAREERSLVFNPRTQKMEVYDNPLKKKKQGFFPWQK